MPNETPPTAPAETVPPGSLDDNDILDWDFHVKEPPDRPRGVVKVRLEFRGRDKPFPVLEPDDEAAENCP